MRGNTGYIKFKRKTEKIYSIGKTGTKGIIKRDLTKPGTPQPPKKNLCGAVKINILIYKYFIYISKFQSAKLEFFDTIFLKFMEFFPQFLYIVNLGSIHIDLSYKKMNDKKCKNTRKKLDMVL